jgi:hypothetical protein
MGGFCRAPHFFQRGYTNEGLAIARCLILVGEIFEIKYT